MQYLLFSFRKDSVGVFQQMGCVELHYLAIERDLAIVLIGKALKKRSLEPGDGSEAIPLTCSARVKSDFGKHCDVLGDAAN